MNKDTLKGQWKQFSGEVKTRWGKLTDNHLTEISGNYDKLVGRIQEAYGYQREQAQREVDNFLNSYPDTAFAGRHSE
jgi:uncharacterized protein YjbJ (UPF0337 family)